MRDSIVILVVLLITRILFAIILMLRMFKRFDLGGSSLHILVCMFYMIYGWMGNEVQVIIVEIVPKEQRNIVMRGMVFLNFGGKTLGLFLAMPVILLVLTPVKGSMLGMIFF